MNEISGSVTSGAAHPTGMGTRRVVASVAMLALCANLAGCGQRGPLRLPATPSTAPAASSPTPTP
jgi:predicted small lipoprotein YifL